MAFEFLSGILGGGDSQSLPTSPGLNPAVSKSINDRIQAANQYTGDYEKDKAAGLFKDFQAQKYDLGGEAANSAIAAKANAKFYDPAIEQIKTMQKANWENQVQQKMKDAQQLGLGELQYQQARYMAMAKRRAQEESQRAQMIGSLFQTGGMIGGAMIGGMPGAMAGEQAGKTMAGGPGDQGGPAGNGTMQA